MKIPQKISNKHKILLMKVLNFLTAVLLVSTALSCSRKVAVITSAKSDKLAIDITTDAYADQEFITYLQPFKQKMDAEMAVVIGYAPEAMTAHRPESLLSNFSADMYKKAASDYLKQDIDMAIVNLGGIRSDLPAGDVTIRKAFELMPFENELVVVWLSGNKLQELLNGFAAVGGQGIAGVSMEIKNKEATNVVIAGASLDPQKIYTIAVNDYIADGNDGMVQLTRHLKRLSTGLKIRDVLINHIKAETAKGNFIQSKLDGRIRYAD